ncbi:type II-A CRISPR-associated protein Csn2 [Vagococcus jeotgali]|uniref:type II-A CRISPR-associated protein Csn2 n=1 Tax=Vagococcus jeotgali TaxID=3109030 RepID=UPI002DD9AB76|nr:type II-A CRISPR-associated protein Csn2 [Vagococcus sp. B2T-5]
MININFPVLDEPIVIDGATYLVVEDQSLFAHLTKLFYQYDGTSELRLFYKDYKGMKTNEISVISDIFGFDVNQASVLKLIYSDIENQLNDQPEIKTKIEQLANTITTLIGHEILNHDLDLEYDEITILELLKSLGVKVETASDTIYEKMIEILQIFKYLPKKNLLVFINVTSYFNEIELKEITEFVSLLNMDVLFLETTQKTYLNQYVVDTDFYVYQSNMV